MKVMIAMPCMSMVHTQFVASLLQLRVDCDIEFAFTESSLIYDARNQLARKAVEENFDRVLWLDSDMTFSGDIMKKLSKDIDTGIQMVSALYFTRRAPIKPVIYSECGSFEENGEVIPKAENYLDYPDGSVFEIAACGFGGVMMTTDLIKRVADEFGLPFSPILGFGEDLSFCAKVGMLGEKVYCDSSVKMGHIGYYCFNEQNFRGNKNE